MNVKELCFIHLKSVSSVEIEPNDRTITLTTIINCTSKSLTKETEYGAEH